ncbi:hypothetical protein D8B34_24555 [Verminephrobacter eiseniae]|nr:hypothetical protein [Verminephrobacter eiseniae]MCW5293304.1 hypothetical protein [Verminephrobacter eiseniae]MCW8187528.1 hypothetical protein [Verminephrobacter eiseniae]MCW8225865.1 hypothetical protein [Verminephrobacter eiseniae]MCW8236757.1 hypothetical protein [Verminephrobacter eiseniae]
MQDGRSPVSASGHGSRESGRLGSAVQRHEPVGDHRAHAAGQCVGPAHAGLLALGADGVTQRIDGSDVPRRISARANFGHPQRATQLFEFQRLVLHRQFVATLAFAVEPLEAAAAPVAASYAEFVALERQAAAAPAQRRFWRERLARAVLPGRLAALAPPAGGVHRRMQLRQAPARSARLEAAATEAGVPLKSLLLAAHLAALARVDGQAMQTTGVEFNGRPEVPGGDRLVGVFNNMLPLTLDLGGLDWRELARACLREERDMLPWRRFPYAELLRLNGARAPFEALFVYTHFHAYRAAEGPGLRITGHFANDQTYMPLTVHFNRDHRDGALEILLDFDERQVAAPAAERFARALQQIGRPSSNATARILDGRGRLAPIGVAGELCIGGAGVARGYLRQPALTAGRFVPDPFGAAGARLYRTGDLARWNAGGEVEYLGREDHQVKISGWRIELAEVEAALMALPGVQGAKAVLRDGRLVGYLVRAGDATTDADALHVQLHRTLPAPMVPARLVPVACLPVNVHGKLDLDALAAEEQAAAAQASPQSAEAADPAEARVAEVWKELLQVARVGPEDDFFALGGHSLAAIRVVSRLRERLGLQVGIRQLFLAPTLREFVRAIGGAQAAVQHLAVRADRSAPMRLSFAQESLWFLCQLSGKARSAYLLAGGLRLTGALDRAVLEGALHAIVARHEVLRTVFTTVQGRPRARPVPATQALSLQVLDAGAEADPLDALQGAMRAAQEQPFDLAAGPLVRATLFRLSERRHVLFIVLHHILADGWSMSLLAGELSAFYLAGLRGEPAALPTLQWQYADYAAWQHAEARDAETGLRYWLAHLAGAATDVTLAPDRPRPRARDFAGAGVEFTVEGAIARALEALARRHGATVFMVMIGAYVRLLTRLAGRSEIVVGTPAANRELLDTEPLIGLFGNTLALRFDLAGCAGTDDLLAHVKQVTLAAQEHQHVPIEQVVSALNPPRSLARSPLFQVMFTWQNTPPVDVRLEGLEIEEIHPEQTTAQCDLQLVMEQRADGMAGTLVYATALYERGTVERFLDNYLAVLREMTIQGASL